MTSENDLRNQRSKISFSNCIMGNSTQTDTTKAAAYEIPTTPTKEMDCKVK